MKKTLTSVIIMMLMIVFVGSAYLLQQQQASAKEPDFRLNQQFHFNDNNGNDKTNCSIQSIQPHTKDKDAGLFPHRERIEC